MLGWIVLPSWAAAMFSLALSKRSQHNCFQMTACGGDITHGGLWDRRGSVKGILLYWRGHFLSGLRRISCLFTGFLYGRRVDRGTAVDIAALLDTAINVWGMQVFTNRTFEKILEFLFQPGFLERNVYVFETEQLPVSVFDFFMFLSSDTILHQYVDIWGYNCVTL